jgi:hypothetical protein
MGPELKIGRAPRFTALKRTLQLKGRTSGRATERRGRPRSAEADARRARDRLPPGPPYQNSQPLSDALSPKVHRFLFSERQLAISLIIMI